MVDAATRKITASSSNQNENQILLYVLDEILANLRFKSAFVSLYLLIGVGF
jgi:hypothetical protein